LRLLCLLHLPPAASRSLFLRHASAALPDPHSFPTRRSSDLPIEPEPPHPASASSAPEAYACARAVLTISFPDRVSQLRSAIRFSPISQCGRRPCRPPVQGLGPRCSR